MILGSTFRRKAPNADMYKCRHVARVLQAYVDGEVDDTTARKVSVHLESCRRCGFEAGAYRELIASLGRIRPSVDPETVENLRRFADRIDEIGD